MTSGNGLPNKVLRLFWDSNLQKFSGPSFGEAHLSAPNKRQNSPQAQMLPLTQLVTLSGTGVSVLDYRQKAKARCPSTPFLATSDSATKNGKKRPAVPLSLFWR